MSRRLPPPYLRRFCGYSWQKPHLGRFWKRRLHKAERAYARGHGKERSVVGLTSTVNYKAW